MSKIPPYRFNGGFEPLQNSQARAILGECNPLSTAADPAESSHFPSIEGPYYFGEVRGKHLDDPYYFGEARGKDSDDINYSGECSDKWSVDIYYHRERRRGPGAVEGWVFDGWRNGPENAFALANPGMVPRVYPEAVGTDSSTRPLTVAHVGAFMLRGGAEQWLLDLARAMDPNRLRLVRAIAVHGHMVDVDYVNQLTQLGVTVEIGREESIQAAARECDVLISWGVELDAYLGETRAPISVHVVHGDGPANRWFLENSNHSVDHVVAVSHRVQKTICRDRSTTVIYNGIDQARLMPQRSRSNVRARLGFAREDFVVGYFGRLAPEKRVSAIIDAVALLPGRFKLLLVGWGQQYAELREHAERALPGRHQFAYTSTGLGDLYRTVDAVCLASNQEGLPLVMLEAMSCARPFVTTPVGAALEMIEDRVNGLIFDGRASTLAAVLSNLARYPEWRRGVGRSGRLTFEQFGTARRMASDYEHLVHRLWAEKHAS